MKDLSKSVPVNKKTSVDAIIEAVEAVAPGAHIVIDGKHLRIIDIDHEDIVTLVEMDTRSLHLFSHGYHRLLDSIEDGSIQVIQDTIPVFDQSLMSEAEKKEFDRKKNILTLVSEEFGPKYFSFRSTQAKQFCAQLAEEYDMNSYSIREMVRDWLQSGMRDYALLRKNSRAFLKGGGRKLYRYSRKAGHGTASGVPVGTVMTDHILKCIEAGYRYYKSDKSVSLQAAFREMNCRFFRNPDYTNYSPGDDIVLVPQTERPTFEQFYYQIRKMRDRIDEDISRYGELEVANNRRILPSDELFRVYGSGDLAQVDALEVDISIISSTGEPQSIGRPILYTMIDTYSKLILSVSVGFDNNSFIGLTNLFANLVRPAPVFRNGLDDIQLLHQGWVTGILPDQIRTDRGSDFLSRGFEKFCQRTGLYHEINRGGFGSGKGSIEAFHHSLHAHQQAVIRDAGLITQDHDSNHHRKARMTLQEYASLIAREVERHNKSVMMDYNEGHNRELIDYGIRAVPLELWEYGQKYGSPRTITNEDQFFFDLLLEAKASVTREGFVFKKLRYFSSQSAKLIQDMYSGSSVSYIIRYDPRSVNAIFFMEDGEVLRADLNEKKTGSYSFRNLTWAEYECYMKQQNKMDIRSREINENLDAKKHLADKEVVKRATDRGVSSDKDILTYRRAEQKQHQKDNAIADKISVAEDAETVNSYILVPDDTERSGDRGESGKSTFVMPPDTDLPPGMY